MTPSFSLSALLTALFVILPGCTSFYGQAKPKVETWEVSQPPSPSSGPDHASAPAASKEQGVAWKGISVGKTTQQEVEERFGEGKASHGHFLYDVDATSVAIAYSNNQTVQSIAVTPAVKMDEADLVAAYGKADRERRSDDFLRVWEYDQAGMTIEFAPDDTIAARVIYHAPVIRESSLAGQVAKTNIPSRPPLNNLSERLAGVQALLNQSAKGFSWVGADQEYSQAQKMYSVLHQQWPVVTDRDMQRYLSGVMDRLTQVTPQPPFPWTVRVIDASTLNAMNLGGGIILINSGLFKHLDSEAQLAYVIAHEMGHQLKQHLASLQTKQQLAQLLLAAATLATAGAGHAEAARAINNFGSLAAGATLASFSREQEVEADLLGLHILNAADYDPREAEKVMEKFIELRHLHGSSLPLFSTHPDPEVRLSNLRTWLASLGEADYSARLVTTQEFVEFKELYRY